ncbi:lysophospholipid acyltransferase family protein [Rossellomorea aquimaris]|uniref:lysophospholipid acyltransferase family protein n=1 Tax=Rossellomorea aquimaris TaxID=189382 RepID=UPI0007D07CCE|nr:lysophospholipid acyltransferase family protein [Rossellomorea aquimaris]
MIEAKKSKGFQKMLAQYLTFQLKKQFYRVWIDDRRNNRDLSKGHLILANHSNWWDGLMIFYLNQYVVKEDSYAMMSQKGIEDFSFFRKIGAFSVNPESPKDLIVSLRFAEKCLSEQKTVWIFPQGKEEHLEKRPLSFMKGPSYLLEKKPEVDVTFVTFYYTFHHNQRPELYIQLRNVDSKLLFRQEHHTRIEQTNSIRMLLEQQLDELRDNIINNNTMSFDLFVKGFRTSSEWLSFWKRRK